MTTYCPIDGTKCVETSYGRIICPTCSFVVDDSIAEKEDKTKRPREYIG
jgi:uncharacterized Zn finger protein (UPF0148 family)